MLLQKVLEATKTIENIRGFPGFRGRPLLGLAPCHKPAPSYCADWPEYTSADFSSGWRSVKREAILQGYCDRNSRANLPRTALVPGLNEVSPRRQTLPALTWIGGERGIRTLGRVSPTHAFQACSFNHSDISPLEKQLLTAMMRANYRESCNTSNPRRSLAGIQYSRDRITTTPF